MKLLIVTSLKEDQPTVARIFEQAQINVFSATDTIGFKDGEPANLLDNWFASGVARYDSIFLFSFTGDDHAARALSLIKSYNEESPGDYPLRAFVLPVEQWSH